MELTAAPIVRKPLEEIGYPGMTDFTRIYIASELNKPEYRTTLRHEQAHVWARHNARTPKDCRHDLWKVACEMEIARTIYDEQDIQNITAPRSRLTGGYLPDTYKDLPLDVVLAEDIYQWLLDNPEQQPQTVKMCCSCCSSGEQSGESAAPADIGVLKAAREKLDAEENAKAAQAAVASAYALAKNRPPTLTDEVDAALRSRVTREKSYRRPSRRHQDSNILAAAAVSIPHPPLVEIFVDRSGSFTPEKTAHAEQQLRSLLQRYGATIRADVWFFGGGKLAPKDPGGGGDTPYHLISQHLQKTTPKLAIIITDDDPVSAEVHKQKSKVLCVPIGCNSTKLAAALGGVDVVTR